MLWVLFITQINDLNDVQEEVHGVNVRPQFVHNSTALCKLGQNSRKSVTWSAVPNAPKLVYVRMRL